MSKSCKSVKESNSQSNEKELWLDKQIDAAVSNLKSRPIERRGPFILSDEDLNEKFSLG